MFGSLTAAFESVVRSAIAVTVESEGDGPIVFAIFFGIGLFLVYGGFRRWQQMRLIQDTPTEKVRSAAVGRTELSGTARPIENTGTVERPFTDGECLVASYKVEEWEEDHDDDDHGSNGHWSTIESGTLSVPFHLDDGTGQMRVEPEDDTTYEISEENKTQFRVGGGRQPPDEVVEFFERHYGDSGGDGFLSGLLDGNPGAKDWDRRRYSERVIPVGADLYLLGGAVPIEGGAGSNAERLVLRRDEGSEEFIISDQSEEELVSDYKWTAPAMIVGGIALSAAMLYLLLA